MRVEVVAAAAEVDWVGQNRYKSCCERCMEISYGFLSQEFEAKRKTLESAKKLTRVTSMLVMTRSGPFHCTRKHAVEL